MMKLLACRGLHATNALLVLQQCPSAINKSTSVTMTRRTQSSKRQQNVPQPHLRDEYQCRCTRRADVSSAAPESPIHSRSHSKTQMPHSARTFGEGDRKQSDARQYSSAVCTQSASACTASVKRVPLPAWQVVMTDHELQGANEVETLTPESGFGAGTERSNSLGGNRV